MILHLKTAGPSARYMYLVMCQESEKMLSEVAIALQRLLMQESKEAGASLISWGEGNEKLKNASVTYYIYGEKFLSAFVNMSEEEFLTDHADLLGNAEISKIAKALQSESYTAMASTGKMDEVAAALIGQLEAGVPDVKAIFEHFAGVSFSEDKLNMELARELLENMQEEDWNKEDESLVELVKEIHGFFGGAKDIREKFKLDGTTRYKFAQRVSSQFLSGDISASTLNKIFKSLLTIGARRRSK